jgi:hypothetical protein
MATSLLLEQSPFRLTDGSTINFNINVFQITQVRGFLLSTIYSDESLCQPLPYSPIWDRLTLMDGAGTNTGSSSAYTTGLTPTLNTAARDGMSRNQSVRIETSRNRSPTGSQGHAHFILLSNGS